MERPLPPPPLGPLDSVDCPPVWDNGFCATYRHQAWANKTRVVGGKPVLCKRSFMQSETVLGQGPTRRTAYHDLMLKTQHWPQAARDVLYVNLREHISLERGEIEQRLGFATIRYPRMCMVGR